MKKLGIRVWGLGIIIFIISVLNIYSQDNDPFQYPFRYNQNPNYYISSDSINFTQNKFAFGFIWSGDYRQNNALKFNMFQNIWNDMTANPASFYNPNTDVIVQIPRVSWGGGAFFPCQTESFQYCPVLKITNRGDFYSRLNDTCHSIFGFSNIDPNIQITNSDIRLQLYKSSSYTNPVLSNPWMSYGLRRYKTLDIDTTSSDVEYTPPTLEYGLKGNKWDGGQFYFSINLRRLDPNDNSMSDDTILSIQLPYKTIYNDSNYIRFTMVPSPIANDTIAIISTKNYYKGCVQNLDSVFPKPNEFFITKNMLPLNSKDITISARFEMSDSSNNNPLLLGYGYTQTLGIVSEVGINVDYYSGVNSCDLGIRWMRIETPVAQDLHRGRFDSSLVFRVQKMLDSMSTSDYKNRGVRPFRVYLRDEQGPLGWGTNEVFQ